MIRAVGILLFFFWCSVLQAQVREIRVGATLPLSGKLSFIGDAYLKGLEMGITQLNNDERLKSHWLFKLIVEDNAGDAATGVAATHKLIEVNNIDLLFTNTTHVATAVAPIAAQREFPMFYAATVRTLAEKYGNVFRDYFDAADSGRALGAQVEKDGRTRIAVLSEQSEACASFTSTFEEAISSKSKIIISELFSPGEVDFKPLLLRLGAKSPDAILFCAWRDTHTIMKQMKQILPHAPPSYHWVAPFLPVSDTQDIRTLLEDNKAVSTWYSLPEGGQSKELAAFVDQFRQRYSENPRPDATYAYDDLMAFGRAIDLCGAAQNSCIIDFLRSHQHSGVSGPMGFSENRVSARPVFLMQLKKGIWMRLENKE